MATYAIGDIQGCFDSLVNLLELIDFNEANDALWFVGDLVNRGPKSLEVLRFAKQLRCEKHIVLGNHDLHLLAVAHTGRQQKNDDSFDPILKADDREELLAWLRGQKFLHYDEKLNAVMTHAGIYPLWDFNTAKALANELEKFIQSEHFVDFLKNMYGNEPNRWNETLSGIDKCRFIVNAFTRMRYCYANGSLDFAAKCSIGEQPENLIPWYKFPNRKVIAQTIIFGHWASLKEPVNNNIFALDTGCVWGKKLTALRIEDKKIFHVPSIN